MEKIIKMMDVDLSIIDENSLITKIDEYLLDDSLNTILFISTDGMEIAAENDEIRGYVQGFDIVLPGEKILLESSWVSQSVQAKRDTMVADYDAFGSTLENLQKKNRTMFIVGNNEEEIERLRRYCETAQPDLQMVGSYSYDRGLATEAALNEINSHAPDMLLVWLDSETQTKWVAENRQLLNAKLAVAIGGIADKMIRTRESVPPIWKKLGCEQLYRYLFCGRVTDIFRKGIFQKRLEQYNKRKKAEKEEESCGNN